MKLLLMENANVFQDFRGNLSITSVCRNVLQTWLERTSLVFVHLEIELLMVSVQTVQDTHNMSTESVYATMEILPSMDNAKDSHVLMLTIFMILSHKVVSVKVHLLGSEENASTLSDVEPMNIGVELNASVIMVT